VNKKYRNFSIIKIVIITMVVTKKSYKSESEKMNKIDDKKLGQEFGAIIENDPENYVQTGKWRNKTPVIDREKCKACKICAEYCPEAAIEVKKVGDKKIATVDYNFCKGCGICAEECPQKAIKMK
jgi:pyruvate ferredoxin oxidoreductase delta subunit